MYLFKVGWLLFTNVLRIGCLIKNASRLHFVTQVRRKMQYVCRVKERCIFVILTEGRVYCQDAHASPWIPLGYSCPVMCQNIISAIEKLKVIDYKRVLDDDRKQRLKMNYGFVNSIKNKVNTNEEHTDDSTKENLYNKPWKEKSLDKSFRNKYTKKLNEDKNEFLNDYKETSIDKIGFPNKKYQQAPKQDGGLQPAVNSLTYFEKQHNNEKTVISDFKTDNFEIELKRVFENRTCDWFKSKQPYLLIRKIIKKCNRKHRRIGYGEDFLRTLTRTMNRFSKVSFEFTEDMVELVLERVFGKNVELRDNIFDVDKLLSYLRNAMAHHEKHDTDSIIVLKPRHCMSVSVPGCFCRPGFVESSGQCVKPADCITESSNEIYLTRIIVH